MECNVTGVGLMVHIGDLPSAQKPNPHYFRTCLEQEILESINLEYCTR